MPAQRGDEWADSVVVHDIPPGVIAVGNPARVVKELE